jgi:hypothetical protein
MAGNNLFNPVNFFEPTATTAPSNDLSTLSTEQLLEVIKKQQETIQTQAQKTAPHIKAVKLQPSGVISVYGINARFPVSLYPSQWVTLLNESGQIKKFIEDNKNLLKFEK